MIDDFFKIAMRNIGSKKLRSWLTILGIFIGIMSVVALMSLGEGLTNFVEAQASAAGTDKLMIMPGGGDGTAAMAAAGGFGADKLTEKDVEVVRDVRGVKAATGVLQKYPLVFYKDESGYLFVACVFTDTETKDYYKDFIMFQVDRGRYFNPGEKNKAIVGVGFTEEDQVFEGSIDIGDSFTIEGRDFEVIAVNMESGNPGHDYKIEIPMDACWDMYNITSKEVSMISAQVEDIDDTAAIVGRVKKDLRRSRNVREGEEDFNVQTVEQLIGMFTATIDIVQYVVAAVAAISIIVGATGIMNTMYTSVTERTREIGIMKAIGARNSDVLTIFMIEAGYLGLIGGIVGSALGLGIAMFVEFGAREFGGIDILRVSASPMLLGGALLGSFLLGAFSGLLPAWKAAKLKPVDALRY